jgi:hypothetical protein
VQPNVSRDALVVRLFTMPTLALTNFNIICSVLGGFITLFGLVSYLFKEKFYLSEARMLRPVKDIEKVDC